MLCSIKDTFEAESLLTGYPDIFRECIGYEPLVCYYNLKNKIEPVQEEFNSSNELKITLILDRISNIQLPTGPINYLAYNDTLERLRYKINDHLSKEINRYNSILDNKTYYDPSIIGWYTCVYPKIRMEESMSKINSNTFLSNLDIIKIEDIKINIFMKDKYKQNEYSIYNKLITDKLHLVIKKRNFVIDEKDCYNQVLKNLLPIKYTDCLSSHLNATNNEFSFIVNSVNSPEAVLI